MGSSGTGLDLKDTSRTKFCGLDLGLKDPWSAESAFNNFEGITEIYTSSKNHLWSLASHVGFYRCTWPWSNMIWPWPQPCCLRTHPC